MRFMSTSLFGLLFLFASCTSVQTRTQGKLLVTTTADSAPEQFAIEVVESHDLTGLAVACWLTGIFYGGACWGYLGAPFDNQRSTAALHLMEEGRVIGRCVDVVDVSVAAQGWGFVPRSAVVRDLAGRMLPPTEVRTLCVSKEKPDPFAAVGTSSRDDDWPVVLAVDDEPHRPFAEAVRRCLWRGDFTAELGATVTVRDASGLQVSQDCVDEISARVPPAASHQLLLRFSVVDAAPKPDDTPDEMKTTNTVHSDTPYEASLGSWWPAADDGGCVKGKRCGNGCIRSDATCHIGAPQTPATSVNRCKTGCPCGGACISCSKQCRH